MATPPPADTAPSRAEMERLLDLYRGGDFASAFAEATALARVHPRSVALYNFFGTLFWQQGRFDSAEATYRAALAVEPDNADLHFNLAATLRRLGRNADAAAAYGAALARRPAHAEAANNLGVVLLELDRREDAAGAFQTAINARPDYAEAIANLAEVAEGLGRDPLAVQAWSRLAALRPEEPAPLIRLGLALRRLNRLLDAVQALGAAFDMGSADPAMLRDLGYCLLQLGRPREAAAAYSRLIEANPADADACHAIGIAFEELGEDESALAAWRQAEALAPHDGRAFVRSAMLQRRRCDWQGHEALVERVLYPPEGGIPPAPGIALLLVDDPALHRARAAAFSASRYGAIAQTPIPRPAIPQRRLQIGYLSPDWYDHPVMHLLCGVLAAHDRSRVEVVGLSIGQRADAMTETLRGRTDRWLDLSALGDEEAAKQVRALGLDVAIDLAGHAFGARSGILARRIAPLQVGFLGYPGTMAAPFIDRIVTDRHVVPEAERAHVAEKLIVLPHSFQPNDNARPLGTAPTRAELGLPEQGFVFCCFNAAHKIGPAEWDVWMRLLAAVEGSVLWLGNLAAAARDNLRREAAARGVDAARLVLAERLDYPDHLARHARADLFLDTFAYNAHTTASDALWGGLPVLTLAGRSYAARVGASLLHAVGLPELVAATAADYEALALALARDPERLAGLRTRLAASRRASALFDTQGWTRAFEAGLLAAFEAWRTRAPADAEDIAV